MTTLSAHHEQMLTEIFMRPANEIKTDRFAAADAAGCGGICKSGTCETGIDPHEQTN